MQSLLVKMNLIALGLGLSLVACVDAQDDGKPDVSDVKGGVDGKAEAWGSADNPALFNNSLEYTAAALPATGEARNIPWAGNYWPIFEDSINTKWNGPSSEAPSTKYGHAFGVTGVEDAVSQNHGIDSQSSRTACTTDTQCNPKLSESCAIRQGQTAGRCIPTWYVPGFAPCCGTRRPSIHLRKPKPFCLRWRKRWKSGTSTPEIIATVWHAMA